MNLIASYDISSGGIVLFYLFIQILLVLLVGFAVALIVIWVVTLLHCIKHEDVPDRTLWIILHIIVGTIIGPIYWFAVKKPYEKSKLHALGKTNKK